MYFFSTPAANYDAFYDHTGTNSVFSSASEAQINNPRFNNIYHTTDHNNNYDQGHNVHHSHAANYAAFYDHSGTTDVNFFSRASDAQNINLRNHNIIHSAVHNNFYVQGHYDHHSLHTNNTTPYYSTQAETIYKSKIQAQIAREKAFSFTP
jgi:hypothetical protein